MENLHKTAFRLLYNLHAVDSSESRYFTFWIARPKKKRVSNETKCIDSYVCNVQQKLNERNHNNEKWIWKDTILMYVWVLMTFFILPSDFLYFFPSSSFPCSPFKSSINRNSIILWWKKVHHDHVTCLRLTWDTLEICVKHLSICSTSSRNHFLNLLIWWHCVKFSDMMIRHYWKKSEITFFSWTLFSIKR